MKKIIFLLAAFISLNFGLFANIAKYKPEIDVPELVKAAFSKQYPGIVAKWEKEDNFFEANFEKDSKEMSATYDSKGLLIETETEIELSELPVAIKEYVKSNYKKEINEACIVTDKNGLTSYEVEVGKKDLIFDASGKFLRESKD